MKIIFPWVNDTDWTANIYDSLVSNYSTQILCIERNIDHIDGGFLKNKSLTTFKIVNDQLLHDVDVAIFIDSNFIDFRTIKLFYPNCHLIGLINGGEFQEYGFSHKLSPQSKLNALAYEAAMLSYLDGIILPSKSALLQFITKYPDLQQKTTFKYLPLNSTLLNINRLHKKNKNGICFSGRRSFDKGYDVVEELMISGSDVKLITGEKKVDYYNKLNSFKYALFPSREELFGYAVAESILSGVMPILPKSLSYTELTRLPYYLNELSSDSIVDIINEYEKLSSHQMDDILENNVRHLITETSGCNSLSYYLGTINEGLHSIPSH